MFSAVASGLFILPFFLLSAISGQLADMTDKARIVRFVKAAEIGIMPVGAAGLLLAWKGIAVPTVAIPLMLLALLAMGVHSTFFGPIKYAILPQHLHKDEVLAGTGLVEAGPISRSWRGRSWLAGSGCNGPRWAWWLTRWSAISPAARSHPPRRTTSPSRSTCTCSAPRSPDPQHRAR